MNDKVVFTGDKFWNDEGAIWIALDTCTDMGYNTIYAPEMHGITKLASPVAYLRNINVIEFPAQWTVYGSKADQVRTSMMINELRKEGGNCVFTFHNNIAASKGTRYAIVSALSFGLEVIHFTKSMIYSLVKPEDFSSLLKEFGGSDETSNRKTIT